MTPSEYAKSLRDLSLTHFLVEDRAAMQEAADLIERQAKALWEAEGYVKVIHARCVFRRRDQWCAAVDCACIKGDELIATIRAARGENDDA